MRVSLAAAALFLVGAPTMPAMAGGAGATILPCAVVAGQTALPADLCRHLASAVFGPAARIDFSVLAPVGASIPALARIPGTPATSPMAPGTALASSTAFQAHLDKGVTIYGSLFGADRRSGIAYEMPAAPSVLWPGGNPFTTGHTD